MMKNNKNYYHLNMDDVKKIQSHELDILCCFIDACKKMGLTYYLHGGTLLGAEMYKGFIPWDDDVDVSMPRDDYETFLKKGHLYLPKNLFIQSCYNDKEYTLCFAKVRKIDTVLVEYSFQHREKMIGGVYIDVFPIDGMKNKKRSIYARLLRRRIDMSYWDVEYVNLFKKIALTIIVFPFLFVSANRATKMLDSYRKRIRVKDISKAKVVLINRWYYPVSYYYPKPECSIMFCGIEMNVVRNADTWLLIDYPNYKTIPSKEKQVPGHKLVKHQF